MLPARQIIQAPQDLGFLARSAERHPVGTVVIVKGGVGALWGGLAGLSLGGLVGAKLGALVGGALMGLRGYADGKELEAWLKGK